jgi:hypothetical protein
MWIWFNWLSIVFIADHSERALKSEPSSPPRTLGSWDLIPRKAWMSVYIYSVFVLSYVQVAALRRADLSSKESYRLCIN